MGFYALSEAEKKTKNWVFVHNRKIASFSVIFCLFDIYEDYLPTYSSAWYLVCNIFLTAVSDCIFEYPYIVALEFLSPPVRFARWAHMRRLPSVCLSVPAD